MVADREGGLLVSLLTVALAAASSTIPATKAIDAIVISQQRSGSNWLTDSLNSHPDMVWGGEYLFGAIAGIRSRRRGSVFKSMDIIKARSESLPDMKTFVGTIYENMKPVAVRGFKVLDFQVSTKNTLASIGCSRFAGRKQAVGGSFSSKFEHLENIPETRQLLTCL